MKLLNNYLRYCILTTALCLVFLLSACGHDSVSGTTAAKDVTAEGGTAEDAAAENVTVEDVTTGDAAAEGVTATNASENENETIAETSAALASESKESSAEAVSYSAQELKDFDNTILNWGQGVHFNSKNQPEGSLDYQKKYGSYRANFIGANTDDKVIWLTMDEGYENGYTEKILDVLKEKDCQVVFFITGSYAENNPELINRMISEGHVVGNHSWSHPSGGMPSLSIEEQIADITKLHDFVKEHYNYEMNLFRNPAGIFSEQSLAVTQSLGYRSMFWSFAYADWDPDDQPDQTQSLEKLVERLHPGALYLLHAVSATNTAILGDFIDQAREKGYTFELPN